MAKIQRALVSVSDKMGLVAFAQILAQAKIEMLSTGGTAKMLREAGIAAKDISEHTGFPEMMDGRVKTLHPKVHGGLLYIRGNEKHEAAAREHGITPIDLVVVNLYPFEQTVAKPDVTLHEAIENIDIGGPSMLRSAAKNHDSVTVVVDPADYAELARQITDTKGTTLEFRRKLAAKVFARTAEYDAAIASHLAKAFSLKLQPAAAPLLAANPQAHQTSQTRPDGSPSPGGEGRGEGGRPTEISSPQFAGATRDNRLPEILSLQEPRAQSLRYGENPHQAAALYGRFHEFFQQLHGKELSYNNILDLTAAAALITEFAGDAPTLAILKHMNPCGVGQAGDLRAAWDKAFATDRQAPFGGIIAVNQPLDASCAEAISEIFSEVIIAPDFSAEALALLQRKKNLRLLKVLKSPLTAKPWDVRSVGADSYLLQERDLKT